MTFKDIPSEAMTQEVLLLGISLPVFLLVALFVLHAAWRNRA